MSCCLRSPSHYLNQCWLVIRMVPWHSSQGIIERRDDPKITISKIRLIFLIASTSPLGQWVNQFTTWSMFYLIRWSTVCDIVWYRAPLYWAPWNLIGAICTVLIRCRWLKTGIQTINWAMKWAAFLPQTYGRDGVSHITGHLWGEATGLWSFRWFKMTFVDLDAEMYIHGNIYGQSALWILRQ